MSITTNILVVSPDSKLQDELRSALQSLGDRAPVANFASEPRTGIEAARSRQPEVVLVEMGLNLSALKAFADELAASAPEAVLVAVFRPEVIGNDVSEGAVLIEAIRCGVKDFLRRPISTTELDQLLVRAGSRGMRSASRPGAVVSFISNKGGVGKSTLAVNAAVVLARKYPQRVLLIDASLQLGVAASMLDLHPATTLTDAVHERERLDETFLRQLAVPHSSGLHLLAAPHTAIDAAQVDDEAISRVITLARRTYDFVLVDTFPLFDRVVVAVLDLSERAYLVMENVVPTLLGAAKLIELLAGLGFPIERQKIVLNRYTSVSGGLSPLDVANRLGRSVDFVLPYDKRVVVAANTGRPYGLSPSRWFGFGPPLSALAADMESLVASQARPSDAPESVRGVLRGVGAPWQRPQVTAVRISEAQP
ncbi:MAG TPA: AAA family ATPase [Pirellulaceae bacterium]|nr:AAA family ATPase [Pirellulaceae bacterium]